MQQNATNAVKRSKTTWRNAVKCNIPLIRHRGPLQLLNFSFDKDVKAGDNQRVDSSDHTKGQPL